MRIAIETGTHSLWISEHLHQLGHEVLVANAREIRAITHSDSKSDQLDAEKLARYARIDPRILHPITHRSVEMQRSLNVIRARDVLVRMRTMAENAVRGQVKPCGRLLPICSTESFAQRCRADLPVALLNIAEPLLKQIEHATEQIAFCDKRIEELADGVYSETTALRQIPGVGALTALTYVLTVADKRRFSQSRMPVAISVSGRGAVSPAILTHNSALPNLGARREKCEEASDYRRGRKLSILLHRLWVTQAEYIPFYEEKKQAA